MRKTTRSDKLESANVIADRLNALLAGSADEIPQGFKSAQELAQIVGRSSHNLMETLNGLARVGKIEKRKILVKTDGGRRLTSFYKI